MNVSLANIQNCNIVFRERFCNRSGQTRSVKTCYSNQNKFRTCIHTLIYIISQNKSRELSLENPIKGQFFPKNLEKHVK